MEAPGRFAQTIGLFPEQPNTLEAFEPPGEFL
jgi:hypothetical protein